MPNPYKPCPQCGGMCARQSLLCFACRYGKNARGPAPACNRCGTPISNRSVTGMCRGCWNAQKREQGRAARLAALPETRQDDRERDTCAVSLAPAEPCPHPPGSEERIRTLERRAARGESMTHPEDFQHD